MLFTPSGPSSSMAWPIRSVRPQLSIRKPRSRWNLSVAALESRRLKELKQHSGLTEERRERDGLRLGGAATGWLERHGFMRCACSKYTPQGEIDEPRLQSANAKSTVESV